MDERDQDNERNPSETHAEYVARVDDTAGKKKLMAYVRGLSDDPSFSQRVSEIRSKYGLPPNGLPEYEWYTSEWDGQQYTKEAPDGVDAGALRTDALKLGEEFALDLLWETSLLHYIVYNDWDMHSMGSMFTVMDINGHLNGPYPEYIELEDELSYVQEMAKTQPVALLISPYASQRDIIDYIKKSYRSEIEPMQKTNRDPKIKIGKLRRRNERVQRRNAFIKANAHLPHREIVRLIADATGEVLDYTYIAKIIGQKKKK